MDKYKLKEYIDVLERNNLVKELVDVNNLEEREVKHFSYNSNDIVKDTMFICKGAAFREEYLKSSIDKGAFVYISEKKYNIDF